MAAGRNGRTTSSISIDGDPMPKLALKLDDLKLQSFPTTLAAGAADGTVLAHQEEASYDTCPNACVTQIYTCAGCETYDDACSDDGPDGGRRIIVYS